MTGIHHVESVDLVFEPAADGRVLEALSALAMSDLHQDLPTNDRFRNTHKWRNAQWNQNA